jgi:type I restriction enzyme S subunit
LIKASRSDFLRDQVSLKFITTAGQKTINQGHISSLLFPLSPLPEQHRIVAKVDELMALCDALETQIEAANRRQSNLLAAVMAAV